MAYDKTLLLLLCSCLISHQNLRSNGDKTLVLSSYQTDWTIMRPLFVMRIATVFFCLRQAFDCYDCTLVHCLKKS